MSINGLTKSTIHPMHKVRARINFVTSRTFVCRKCRGEPQGLFFRGMPPNTPGEKRDAMFGLFDLQGFYASHVETPHTK